MLTVEVIHHLQLRASVYCSLFTTEEIIYIYKIISIIIINKGVAVPAEECTVFTSINMQ